MLFDDGHGSLRRRVAVPLAAAVRLSLAVEHSLGRHHRGILPSQSRQKGIRTNNTSAIREVPDDGDGGRDKRQPVARAGRQDEEERACRAADRREGQEQRLAPVCRVCERADRDDDQGLGEDCSGLDVHPSLVSPQRCPGGIARPPGTHENDVVSTHLPRMRALHTASVDSSAQGFVSSGASKPISRAMPGVSGVGGQTYVPT